MNFARPAIDRTKTYVVERVATDIYEVQTKDGSAEALDQVTRINLDNGPIAIKNLTEYRVYEKDQERSTE